MVFGKSNKKSNFTPLKVEYNKLRNETTIYFKYTNFKGLWENEFITLKGKINFKKDNPTHAEVFNFIELKGGLKE